VPWLRHVFADGGYAAKGFVLLPRRWVVERTLAWLNRNRRLAKDVERTIESAVTWLYIASVKLMSRRLAPAYRWM
jgi:transposase